MTVCFWRKAEYNTDDVRIDGFPVCALPPLGAVSPSHGTTLATLTLEKGYFRTSNQSYSVRKCYHENACRGGSDADNYCSSGYTGPSMTLLAGLVLFHPGSVVGNGEGSDTSIAQRPWMQKFWSCRASLLNHLPLTAINIVVTVWQILSQFDAIAGGVYPELYTNFISKLNPVNLDLDFVFPYSCLVNNDFYHRLIFATITPLIVLAVQVVSYSLAKDRNRLSESAVRDVQHKDQATLLYVALFVYSPESYRISQTFTCDALDDGETYLLADNRLSCLTSRHRWYERYALTMVAVYPVGIAAAFTWLLFSYRRDLVKSDRETMLHLKPIHSIWAVL